MKILITMLLALFISSQAYAQSPAEILGNGKVVSDQLFVSQDHRIVVVYNNAVYRCVAETHYDPNIRCRKMEVRE